ncbi:tRNA (adenosine(37)-N6)-dimethylallyltransferase MiaA [Motilibacter aurantiacus]|uniref:tRNA (adenosine(37)-N6)-dimethylallyltransferase MiaA n=1 Tax=Motilibacter aurantiacus TaxID=2714955 RepID=UPI00140ABD1B|nr:tRNA (adenosine(37)-N6)-dimethylallyltransferase MiaA [Motilibacter aurantiacus]
MKVIAVVGPTASGKTGLGVQLAQALDGEVVNADSMQLYRGLDIGTAKATREERQGVPHHVLDVWDVTEPASVAEYQRLARQAVAGIQARGRTAVLVGGSGLYVRAALDDMAFPGTDEAVRARLEAELAVVGAPALHARLAERDPAAAAAILPTNGRRVVRALEVGEITGRGFVAELPDPTYAVPAVQIGLRVPRPELDERIARRVDLMWERGLVAEARELCGRGLREGPTAGRALGYAQVLRVLDGEADEEWAREDTVRTTRRFARRQESWFRRDSRVRWLDAGAESSGALLGHALAAVADE